MARLSLATLRARLLLLDHGEHCSRRQSRLASQFVEPGQVERGDNYGTDMARVVEDRIAEIDGGLAGARRDDGFVRVDVSDTGIGLSPEDPAQLFTKFFRAHDRSPQAGGGTGLGLVITRLLVELHGGQITVSSAPGQGSTFSFSLPALEVPA